MHVSTQVAIIFYNKFKIPNSTKQIKKIMNKLLTAQAPVIKDRTWNGKATGLVTNKHTTTTTTTT